MNVAMNLQSIITLTCSSPSSSWFTCEDKLTDASEDKINRYFPQELVETKNRAKRGNIGLKRL